MNYRRILGISLFVVLAVAMFSVAFAGGSAGQSTQCQPIEDRQLCFSNLTISHDELVLGEQGKFSVTVVNEGNESATGAVNLHTAGPQNETNVYRVNEITLEPGESETVSRDINASTPGTHGLRLSLTELSTQHIFDVTDIKTIEILEEHPKELGGPIDRTEIALIVLTGAIISMVVFVYRKASE